MTQNQDPTKSLGEQLKPEIAHRRRKTPGRLRHGAVDVARRRLSGEPCKAIAADYGISESLPREIAAGRAWPDACAQAKREITCRTS